MAISIYIHCWNKKSSERGETTKVQDIYTRVYVYINREKTNKINKHYKIMRHIDVARLAYVPLRADNNAHILLLYSRKIIGV